MKYAARPNSEIARLRAERGGPWPLIRWIRRRRPLLTALFVIAAPLYTLATGAEPYDMLGSDRSWRFFLPWALILFGFGVRLWGSGNLRKNQEITDTGVYQLVRHPLYVGSLAFMLAYFLTVTDPIIGGVLFVAMVATVYYPTMLSEEEYLYLKFPSAVDAYEPPPRLFPDLRRVPAAIQSDRFSVRSAYRNLGFRSAWFIVLLPLFLWGLSWLVSTLH